MPHALKTLVSAESYESATSTDENIWTYTLEVTRQNTRKVRKCGTVVVFGSAECGKSSLIEQFMDDREMTDLQFGLEYHYVEIRDDDGDETASLSIWAIGGSGESKTILKDCVESAETPLFVFLAPFDKPWALIDSIVKWMKLADEIREDSRKMVVITKCDHCEFLRKEQEYTNEHFDFIQCHLRRLCLENNAGLAYVSNKNAETSLNLARYMAHIQCGFPYEYSANVVEPYSIFIPIGWDDREKVSMLEQTMPKFGSTSVQYDSVIKQPPTSLSPATALQQKRPLPARVKTESDQSFLARLYSQSNRYSHHKSEDSGKKQISLRSSAAATKESPSLVQPSSNAVSSHTLQKFFHNLLSQKGPDNARKSSPTGGTEDSPTSLKRRPSSEPANQE